MAQLPATVDGKTVKLRAIGQTYEFAASDFSKIVPGHSPKREWLAREGAALAGGTEAKFAAAWWALENGLTTQAEAMLRAAHQSDPAHEPTARMVAVLDRLAQPCTDPDLEPLRRVLGGVSSTAQGPHVVLLHQHTDAEAAERIALLERVVVSYYLLFASHGINLRPPTQRLASVWFADHDAYLAYLRSEKLGVFRSTRGYYHPTRNAVFTYDARSSGTQRQARDAIAARRRELALMSKTIDQLPGRARIRFEVRGEPIRTLNRTEARTLLHDLERDLARRTLLLDLDWRAMDLGTAAHEMIHQLVAESGLAPHHDDFPLWLHEGLAAQFEVIRGGRWAGIGRAHDIRLPDWRSIQHPLPLATLVQDTGFARGYQRDLYAEAWALVYYLRKEHPQEFLTYLDLLRRPDPTLPRPRQRAAVAFRTAFGDDLAGLEQTWHHYMSSVKYPLEEPLRTRPHLATSRPASTVPD
jgi:hypothetical protein